MAQVSHLMQVGHPIPKHFAVGHAFQLVYQGLQTQLAKLNALPSQSPDRILVANTLILPQWLYRCECLPLAAPQIKQIVWPDYPQYLHRKHYTHITHTDWD